MTRLMVGGEGIEKGEYVLLVRRGREGCKLLVVGSWGSEGRRRGDAVRMMRMFCCFSYCWKERRRKRRRLKI